jgi:hypothetical protein
MELFSNMFLKLEGNNCTSLYFRTNISSKTNPKTFQIWVSDSHSHAALETVLRDNSHVAVV